MADVNKTVGIDITVTTALKLKEIEDFRKKVEEAKIELIDFAKRGNESFTIVRKALEKAKLK